MTETKSNGNGVWKLIAVGFISLSVGLVFAKATEPRDIVSEKELQTQVLVLQNKIDTLNNEVVALRASVNQQNTDIAGIAEKVGVPAHPVVAPSR